MRQKRTRQCGDYWNGSTNGCQAQTNGEEENHNFERKCKEVLTWPSVSVGWSVVRYTKGLWV